MVWPVASSNDVSCRISPHYVGRWLTNFFERQPFTHIVKTSLSFSTLFCTEFFDHKDELKCSRHNALNLLPSSRQKHQTWWFDEVLQGTRMLSFRRTHICFWYDFNQWSSFDGLSPHKRIRSNQVLFLPASFKVNTFIRIRFVCPSPWYQLSIMTDWAIELRDLVRFWIIRVEIVWYGRIFTWEMAQFNARAARIPNSNARLFTTGSTPDIPNDHVYLYCLAPKCADERTFWTALIQRI